MAADRHRIRYAFWLDIKKPDEEMLSDEIELLKNKRSFAGAIRDGLRLILSLREGRVDVLLELFPWIPEKVAPPPSGNDDLLKEIEFMKDLMLSQFRNGNGIQMASAGQGAPIRTPRPSIAKLPTIAPPVVVEVDTSSSFLDMF